ncbi:hypothetical protein [Neobacillus endophyticus]|uniref:hypothetical protein n=1 Tax=Neobacillus endophyticus TaxID=2738405 RepID=UPI001FE9B3B7|nr:hypothetical protein [Neobacillus endophyticus]
MNKSEREKVAKMVEQGALNPNVKDSPWLIHLPKQYQGLSVGGGDIIIEKTGNGYSILFFTYRGILDNFSGFVYTPNDQNPSTKAFDGDFKEIEKMDKNWYFVSSS